MVQLKNFDDLYYLALESKGGIVRVKGAAIENLIVAIKEMYFRGAPVEENDLGFNKGDYVFVSSYLDYLKGDELPSNLVISFIRLLKKYKRSQLPSIGYDYDKEYEEVAKALKAASVSSDIDSDDSSGQKIIMDHSDSQYGKILVTLPTPPKPRDVNKLARDFCEKKGIQRVVDRFNNYDYPIYKVYQPSKTILNGYYIIPELAKDIAEKLYSGIEVEEIRLNGTPDSNDAVSQGKAKVEILGTENTSFGKKLIISLGNDPLVSKKIYFAIKGDGHTPKLMSYQKDSSTGSWRLTMADKKEAFDVLKPYMENDLDISDLETHFSQNVEDVSDEKESKKEFSTYSLIIDYVNENTIKITTDFKSTPPKYKDFFKQAVKYIFPDYSWDSNEYKYVIRGDFEQYVMLGNILKDNFNVDELRSIVSNMYKEGKIQPSRKLALKTQEDVDKSIDDGFDNSAFSLYGLQKEGINFLYKNKYAILGSETGGGKTVQMIYAAELVYKESNLPILIVTLKRVQKQFLEEIVAVMGEKERNEISTDPMVTKKWNVLYYDNFSSGKNLEAAIEHMASQEYSVIILDELHKVKHSTSKRSKNIELVASKAKNRWGATATISSNKPQDVRNQLAILGHPIGKMPEGRFKKEFSGMVPEGYGGAYVENPDFEQRLIAAENLNKWLHLSGVYIRHSKEDMRSERSEKMPELQIDKNIVDSIKDEDEFANNFKRKVSSYEDPELAISKLLAYRDMIASEKTDSSVDMAIDIIKNNYKNPENNYSSSKILIFTNFREAGNLLLQKSIERLSELNPEWKAYSFLSATPKKELDMVKSRMEDKNSKILIMSMKMGGTGISFPNTFKTMIVNDYDWTPESVEQSEGRIYRINTNQNVKIIYNINNGLDEELYDKVEKKKELAKIIQTYRKIYQQEKTTSKDSESLKKIIDAQKALNKVQSDEKDLVSKYAPTVNESFRMFLKRKYSIL